MKHRIAQFMMLFSLGLAWAGSTWAAGASADDRASIRTQLAAEYFKRRQFGVALEEVRKALAANSSYAPAYGMLGLINMELREDEAAAENFRQALSIAPGDSDIRHNHGYFLCDRGHFKAGIAEYLVALKNPLYPTPDKTLVSAGLCAEKGGLPDEAQEYYERALRHRPDHSQAKLLLANRFFEKGSLPDARRLLMELVRAQKPVQADVLWLGVRIERKLGNPEGEKGFAEQLRRLYPDSLEVSRLLAGQY